MNVIERSLPPSAVDFSALSALDVAGIATAVAAKAATIKPFFIPPPVSIC